MRPKAHFNEEQLAQLDQTRDRALACRALECAYKEAQLDRDGLVASLTEQVRDGAPRIAEAALLSRYWPAKIRHYYAGRLARWRSDHPDRLHILLEARAQLEDMIRREEADRGR